MGIEDGSLEMLFIASEEMGKGIGRLLLQHGIDYYGVNRLTVNEQNPQSGGFYESIWGFMCIRGQSLMGRVILILCFTCAYDGNMIFVCQSRM